MISSLLVFIKINVKFDQELRKLESYKIQPDRVCVCVGGGANFFRTSLHNIGAVLSFVDHQS